MAASAPVYEKIAPTAHLTAYVWHQIGMPYADMFATPKGAAMYWAFHGTADVVSRAAGLGTLPGYLEFRHRMLEAELRELDPDRIIELGAGLSRRGVTWALDHQVPYVEIDLPHMRRAKREMLARGPGRIAKAIDAGILRLHATDILAPSFADELAELLAGAERPVVVSEGLVAYFDAPDRDRLLVNIAKGLRTTGGHYLTDLQRRDRERRVGLPAVVLRQAIRLVTRGQGPARPFNDLDHIERVFELAGFDEGVMLKPRQLFARDPKLRGLRSPTTIWLARVERGH